MVSTGTKIVLFVIHLAVAISIGVVIGYFATELSTEDSKRLQISRKLTTDAFLSENIETQDLLNQVSREKIEANLKYLTEKPHIAGSERDNELAKFIQEKWLQDGIENVHLVPYDILLSYPDRENPNKVEILDQNGEVIFTSTHMEEQLREGDFSADFVDAFNGFSPNGTVEGDLVYVNYGTVEDFDELKTLGIDVKNKICIARYGKIFRGNKVQHAAERGAIGVIIFSDPKDVAPFGVNPEQVYPNTLYLPGTGMQRGSVLINHGDPLTPYWPSLDKAYRIKEEDALLPKIPSQPIGYSDAQKLLEHLGGELAPEDWIGGIPNITYKLGPGFTNGSSGSKVRLSVHNRLQRSVNYNVIGQITGAVEPDRYVLLGNHRDAWGYGAMDPSAGTAAFLETTRVLGNLVKTGWRPRRTIVFCSWGAEEYGLIGSIEWVEEKVNKLMERAVSYVNLDTCAKGPIFYPEISPAFEPFVKQRMKEIPAIRDQTKTLYDTWKEFCHKNKSNEEPKLRIAGSGSDHAPFMFYAGVPGIFVQFKHNEYVGQYPAYHTAYETFYYAANVTDPGCHVMQGCSRAGLLFTHDLAESTIIPFNLTFYAKAISKTLDKLKQNGVQSKLEQFGGSLVLLEESIRNFSIAVHEWEERIKDVNTLNPIEVRMLNDQIMEIEKTFIIPAGLPERPNDRHSIFTQSKFNVYGSSGFPGIVDLLYEHNMATDDLRREEIEETIRKHLSDLYIIFHRATDFLKPVGAI